MKHFVLTFIIVLFFSGNALAQKDLWADYADADWEPAAANFEVSTAAQLARLAVLVNGGKTFEGVAFSLKSDIDLSAHYWTPIGENRSVPFCGIFDGHANVIKGLKINNNITDYPGVYSALFGRISGKAEIRNLVLADGEIKGGMGDGALTAALVAEVFPDDDARPILISGCHNRSVKVTTGSGARGGRIGGLIAVVRTVPDGNESASVIIEGCGNKAPVNGVSTSNYTGGLIGWIAAENNASLTVTDCYNEAGVTGSKDCTGGLIGRMQTSANATATLKMSRSAGNVNGGEGYTGGLVGHLIARTPSGRANVQSCTVSAGELTGNKTFTGAFTGKNENGVIENNKDELNR